MVPKTWVDVPHMSYALRHRGPFGLIDRHRIISRGPDKPVRQHVPNLTVVHIRELAAGKLTQKQIRDNSIRNCQAVGGG